MLVLQFAIRTPGFAISHAWSGDGKFVAILFSDDASVYLLDVYNGTINGPVTQDKPSTYLALNSTANLLSVTAGREVRLYATTPVRLLGKTVPPKSCAFSAHGPNVIFTADDAHLWIRCAQPPLSQRAESSPAIAVQYRIPSLQIADILGATQPHYNSRGVIQHVAGLPVLTGFTEKLVAEAGKHRQTIKFGFECVRLDRKAPCFQSFPLRNGRFDPPRRAALSNSFSMVAVGSHSSSPGASRIDIYDTASGTLTSSIDIEASLFLGAFQQLVFAAEEKFLIAAFNASKLPSSDFILDGGIIVWGRESGIVQQDIRRGAVEHMSLSPSGRQLLVVTRREILLYSITI
jgi:hypothetical protein